LTDVFDLLVLFQSVVDQSFGFLVLELLLAQVGQQALYLSRTVKQVVVKGAVSWVELFGHFQSSVGSSHKELTPKK
jgi:hypothetical protein